jgi:hypothetical protein
MRMKHLITAILLLSSLESFSKAECKPGSEDTEGSTLLEISLLAKNGLLSIVLGRDISLNPGGPNLTILLKEEIDIRFSLDMEINDPNYSRTGYKFNKGHEIKVANYTGNLYLDHPVFSMISSRSSDNIFELMSDDGFTFCTTVLDPGLIEFSNVLDYPMNDFDNSINDQNMEKLPGFEKNYQLNRKKTSSAMEV